MIGGRLMTDRRLQNDVEKIEGGELMLQGHPRSLAGSLYDVVCSIVCRPLSVVCLSMLMLTVLLSSCFKEKPISPPHIITESVYVANMGDNYTQQVYFNLQSHQFVDSNSKYDYNMAFDCDPATYNVWINGANLSLACRTGKTNFADVTIADTTQGWHEELGSGIPANNAIGVWGSYPSSGRQIYIINCGVDSVGNSLGFKKMQMGDFVSNSYQVTFCDMDNSNMHTVSVPKKDKKNLVFLSFNNGGVVHDFEPDNTEWDFLFTQYCVFFGPPNNINYKVTGVLTNPVKTFAYFVDSTSNFDNIKRTDVVESKFSTNQDNIGYDWKRFSGVSYSTQSAYVFIVKSNSRYFKLRFLDFNNSSGVKGYPKFQYYELL